MAQSILEASRQERKASRQEQPWEEVSSQGYFGLKIG
jgi:hypothetical protein